MRALLLLLLLAATGGAVKDPWGHGYDPEDPAAMTWIEPGVLALGGGGLDEEQVRWLHAQGFRAIANVRFEHEDPAETMQELDIEHLWIDLEHGVHLDLGEIDAFLAWAERMESEGRPIYLHCTNGWHRSAALAVAWRMARDGTGFEETGRELVEERPGSVMRAPGGMYRHEARLTGVPGLTVMLLSDLERPEPGGSMPVTVEVLLPDGAPAAGADVRVKTEGSLDLTGTTDADGRFPFVFPASRDSFMAHLYAYASLDGHTPGADQLEMFYESAVEPAQDLDVRWSLEPDALRVVVTRDGEPVRARVLAFGADGWFAESFTERWGHEGPGATLPRPPAGEVRLRVERWGDRAASATFEAPVPEAQGAREGGGEGPPTSLPRTDVVELPADVAEPGLLDEVRAAPGADAVPLAVAAVGTAAALAGRRRTRP